MSHYEQRLETDLNNIKEELRRVASAVETALDNATHAVLTLDVQLAAETMIGDLPINRAVREIDRLCHAFVARHLPSARHLRFVSSVLRLNVALERIGDYAVTVGRETVQLGGPLPDTVARDIELISDQARRTLKPALSSFLEGNAELARGTMIGASQVKGTFGKVFADLLDIGAEPGKMAIKDLFAALVIFNEFGRVSDQAKNICEETVFAETGETKKPRIYRVLFIDRANEGRSQIAEAYARKAFPESGKYASAGWEPATEVPGALVEFLEGRGCDVSSARPKPLAPALESLATYHVVVSLEGDARPHLGEIPFRTAVLRWDFDQAGGFSDGELEESYHAIAVRVRELMETLRGEGAS